MREFLFSVAPDGPGTLHSRLRRQVVEAIASGHLPPGARLPSSRRVADRLGIARNTVTAVYADLVAEGHLVASGRSGYFVAAGAAVPEPAARSPAPAPMLGWSDRFAVTLPRRRNLTTPRPWQTYPYPFVYGQPDHALFPLDAWRDCSRRALARLPVDRWTADGGMDDDPALVEQICRVVLPRRGIHAGPDEVIVTLGTQQALFLLAFLLFDDSTVIGIEDPGYADARATFAVRTRRVVGLPVDHDGLQVDERLDACDYVYVTPGHQMPTTVTMTPARRHALLERAAAADVVVIEDDYESDLDYSGLTPPALKSLDRTGRVVHVGSFSKSIAPGLRIGYVVGPKALVRELRHLRRLILRHPPANNQRTLALFLEGGHFGALLSGLRTVYRERWRALGEALDDHLPAWRRAPTAGGFSYWVTAPSGIDTRALAHAALGHGVIIDPGEFRYLGPDPPRNRARLGFAAIDVTRIEPGIRILAEIASGARAGAAS